jgi:AmmeMemoRadiSam system protein B
MVQDIRKSIIAGSWYPGRPQALQEQIRGFLSKVPMASVSGRLVALIVPHAGYIYSGGVAAYAYQLLSERPFRQVVIIAPSHRYPFKGASIDSKDGYETPLGIIPVDKKLGQEIAAENPLFHYVPNGHVQEHALEIQLPFMQEVLKNFSLVAVIQGSQDRATCLAMAQALAKVLKDREILLVASTDLSHFHSYNQARSLDQKVLDRVAAYDENGLLSDLEEDRVEACGGGPMVTVMKTARLLGADETRVLRYANSGDVTGDHSSVVGYMAAALFKSIDPS